MGGGGGFHSPTDIFDMFFGGGGRSRERGPRKMKDVVHQLKVTLFLNELLVEACCEYE